MEGSRKDHLRFPGTRNLAEHVSNRLRRKGTLIGWFLGSARGLTPQKWSYFRRVPYPAQPSAHDLSGFVMEQRVLREGHLALATYKGSRQTWGTSLNYSLIEVGGSPVPKSMTKSPGPPSRRSTLCHMALLLLILFPLLFRLRKLPPAGRESAKTRIAVQRSVTWPSCR